ncbi:MAG: hypothetical protein ACRDT2_11550, partial [Natronosporangium sp.]
MSVNSASNGSRDQSIGAAPGTRPAGRPAGREPTGPPRSAFDWARQRLAGRGTRRLSAAGQRATHQQEHLGTSWQVVELPAATAPAGPD